MKNQKLTKRKFTGDLSELRRRIAQLEMSETERRRVGEELRQRVIELSVLNTLGRQVGSNSSVDQVVQVALEGIVDSVAPDLALLFIRVGEEFLLRHGYYGKAKLSRDKMQVQRVGKFLCDLVASEGEALYFLDIQNDPRCTLPECTKAGVRSFAALPLHRADGTFGVLGLASRVVRDFETQAAFLESLTGQVAIGLQNATLYEKLRQEIEERKEVEQELRKREAELEFQRNKLEEVNSALRVLLRQREEDKTELEQVFVVNVKELILPYIERLKTNPMDTRQKTLLEILESNLADIVSPFASNLSFGLIKLSPTEIKIANLIKDDKTTKEIAELLGASENTIKAHRYHIRSKLGLRGKKTNLTTYLRTVT